MLRSRISRITAVTILISVPAVPLLDSQADTPAATGDLWEVVSQVSMQGLPIKMPAQTMKVCAAKQWTQPPGGDNADRGCTSSDMTIDEELNTVTWTSVCKDGMTGRGEIHRNGDDAYAGEIRYASQDGEVVIALNGHRIGECDNPR